MRHLVPAIICGVIVTAVIFITPLVFALMVPSLILIIIILLCWFLFVIFMEDDDPSSH